MEIKFNATGNGRKALVKAIGEILEVAPKYLGPPTFAYEVDYFTIDKEGTLSFDDRADSGEIENIIESLHNRGFEAQEAESNDRLVIELPRDGVSEESLNNLKHLVESKASLIKKALDVNSLQIETGEERISFPWFDRLPTPEQINVYARFIGKLMEMAKSQKRVTAKEKPVDNEKFAFRCFLLRLGFIGDEFKAERKVLLSRLTGNSAFKSGSAKKEDEACTE